MKYNVVPRYYENRMKVKRDVKEVVNFSIWNFRDEKWSEKILLEAQVVIQLDDGKRKRDIIADVTVYDSFISPVFYTCNEAAKRRSNLHFSPFAFQLDQLPLRARNYYAARETFRTVLDKFSLTAPIPLPLSPLSNSTPNTAITPRFPFPSGSA